MQDSRPFSDGDRAMLDNGENRKITVEQAITGNMFLSEMERRKLGEAIRNIDMCGCEEDFLCPEHR